MKEKFHGSIIRLEHNLRNSQNIVNTSKFVSRLSLSPLAHCMKFSLINQFHDTVIQEFFTKEKTLSGPNNYYYVERDNFDKRLWIEAVVNKHFSNDIQEPVVVFVTNRKEAENIYKWCKKHLSRKVTYIPEKDTCDIHEVEEYLHCPEGVLIAPLKTFYGAQARNTVIFVDNIRESRNEILRSISFTYIIDLRILDVPYNVSKEARVPGLVKDTNIFSHNPNKPIAYHFQNKKSTPEHILVKTIINDILVEDPEHIISVSIAFERKDEVVDNLKNSFAGKFDKESCCISTNKGSIYVDYSYCFDKIAEDPTILIIFETEKYTEIRDLILLARAKHCFLLSNGQLYNPWIMSKLRRYIKIEEIELNI